ncbi:ArnT family glycosyltransferase [Gemmatimonadota bacterium]
MTVVIKRISGSLSVDKLLVPALFLIYALLQIYMLTSSPNILIDEPWYSSIGDNLMQTGQQIDLVRQDHWASLYPIILSVFFNVFGMSLWVARFASVIAGALSLWAFINILKLLSVQSRVIMFTGFTFIVANVPYVIFRTTRPESWVLAFTLWGIYFLINGIINRDSRSFFLSGLLVASSFLSHPVGAITVLLIGLCIFYTSLKNRYVAPLVAFTSSILLILLVFIMYIVVWKDVGIFEFFSSWLSRTSTQSNTNLGQHIISNATSFFQHYTLGSYRLYIVIFEIGILPAALLLSDTNKDRIPILVFLAAGFFIIGLILLNPFSTRYFGLVMIMSLLVYALLLNNALLFRNKMYGLVLIIGLLYLVNNLAGDMYILYRDRHNQPYKQVEVELAEVIPPGSSVASQIWFWFPLRLTDFYCHYTRWEKTRFTAPEDLFASGTLEYVVTSRFGIDDQRISTTGRDSPRATLNRAVRFHEISTKYVRQYGELVMSFVSEPFGEIYVWRLVFPQ